MERLVIRVNDIPTIVATEQIYYIDLKSIDETLEGKFTGIEEGRPTYAVFQDFFGQRFHIPFAEFIAINTESQLF